MIIKRLFLIDAVGALVSSLMLGIILAYIQPLIGMPKVILYNLALVALVLFVYSLLCYLFRKNNSKKLLAVIAIANYTYCLASLFLMITYYNELTSLGILYFVLEKVVVLTLASIELKIALK